MMGNLQRDESATYSMDDALALGLADQLCAKYGLVLSLYGPQSGRWYAEFYDPAHPQFRLTEGTEFIRAPSRAQAIRLAAEQALEALA